MPSVHCAWALWCTCALVPRVKHTWAKVLAILYPVGTVTSITLTANHYLLDAVGGFIVLGAGYLIARLFTRAGRRARRPTRTRRPNPSHHHRPRHPSPSPSDPTRPVYLDHVAFATRDAAEPLRMLVGELGGTVLIGGDCDRVPLDAGLPRRRPTAA